MKSMNLTRNKPAKANSSKSDSKKTTKSKDVNYNKVAKHILIKNSDEGKVLVKINNKTWKYVLPADLHKYKALEDTSDSYIANSFN